MKLSMVPGQNNIEGCVAFANATHPPFFNNQVKFNSSRMVVKTDQIQLRPDGMSG